ncbi:ABC transporter substrate-binding protein [Nocardiopsis sp. NPDC006832]|uniref:ABC transporter substrate-binding protein n=1 Tax=Nocardiopsis sp. NPDC006832 TaxID=3157188 RepID=UPI003410DDC2
MTDRNGSDRSDGTPRRAGDLPGFLQVFEALRSRPRWGLHRRLRRMEARVAHRRPAGKGKVQRGDLAEPPPVLDLVLDDATDHAEVRRMLVQQCAVDPVWLLPPRSTEKPEETREPGKARMADPAHDPREWFKDQGTRPLGPQARPELADTVPRGLPRGRYEALDSDTDVTTDELYDYIEHLVNDGFAWKDSPPKPKRGRRPPPPPRLPRLNSLLWLRRCDLIEIRSRASGDRSEKTPEHGRLENTSQGQTAVINGLREARLNYAIQYRADLLDRVEQAGHGSSEEEPPSRGEIFSATALVHWRRLARVAAVTSRWVTRISGKATFGLADEKILTPLAFIVSLVVTATPFAFVGLAAQQLGEIVSLLTGVFLAVVYLLTVFFFFLPWRPYRWLNHHRYVMDPVEDDSRQAQEPAPEGQGRVGRHRARGVHLLNELHHPQRNKGRIGGADPRKGAHPPGTHRIAVNALLDDLHQVYGANRSRGRARASRPVLVYDQRGLGRVGRYLIRLIEDERLRRALPDPLLLVQIRDRDGEKPLIGGEIAVARYKNLPEFDGTDSVPKEIRGWHRERHLSGALGARRTLTLHVAGRPPESRERSWRTEPTWVMTRPVKAAAVSTGAVAVTGFLVLAGLVLIPEQAQALHPCIDEGSWVPQGITRVKGKDRKECYGVTFGDFVFDERLREVTELIGDQNDAVDDSGKPYVTIAYVGELSAADSKDAKYVEDVKAFKKDTKDSEDSSPVENDGSELAGVQGELLGLAYQQELQNDERGKDRPNIKILLGNVGEDWTYSKETAKEIVDMAKDESLAMDRPIAAIGFGHSVVNNSLAIREVGKASLTMMGTTATFDDVARSGAGGHNRFFFPVAPSNSRIAAQAAQWALEGVSWTDPEGAEHGLPEHKTAVALADAETDAKNNEHEQYGRHLAQEFMEAFVKGSETKDGEINGEAWRSSEVLDSDEYDSQGVLLYQDKTTLREQLRGICSDDPPDLIYYAGRSEDFSGFYNALIHSKGAKCSSGEVTILGGDDISKHLSDEEQTIEDSAETHPVFYTPLAPSGPWGTEEEEEGLSGSGQGFYSAMSRLVCEHYGRGSQQDCADKELWDKNLLPADWLPSIAHAAIGNDALLVIADALPPTGPTKGEPANDGLRQRLGLDQQPFLRTDDDYEEKRDELYGQVEEFEGLTGVSGYINFDNDNDGNWLGGRMVQLVLVGPRVTDQTGDVQRQHVLQRCGTRNSTTVEPGPQCLPVDVG